MIYDLTTPLTNADVSKAIEEAKPSTVTDGIPLADDFTVGVENITDVSTGVIYHLVDGEVKPISFVKPSYLVLPTTDVVDLPTVAVGEVVIYFNGTDLVKRTMVDATITDVVLG